MNLVIIVIIFQFAIYLCECMCDIKSPNNKYITMKSELSLLTNRYNFWSEHGKKNNNKSNNNINSNCLIMIDV